MPTVKQMADHHGVSPRFVIAALAKIGVNAASAEANVSPENARRFTDRYGAAISQSKPTAPEVTDADAEPSIQPESGLPFRGPPPKQMIRVAYARITSRRDMQTMDRYEVLSDNPGPAHAIDPNGTNDGDPWMRARRFAGPFTGAHHFYSHPGPYAACGVRVRVVLEREFTEQTADPCPKCAHEVETGRAIRSPPGFGRNPVGCEDFIRLGRDGVIGMARGEVVKVEECARRWMHDDRHRSRSGSTWGSGGRDYEPAPKPEDD